MMGMVSQSNQFAQNTKAEFTGLTNWFSGLKADFEGKGKPGQELFGPRGFCRTKKNSKTPGTR